MTDATPVSVVIVAAIAANGVIGADGDMPWRLSTDLKRFKSITLGKPVIMGRKTFESIGRPLPGRLNIVVTRSKDYAPEGVKIASSLEEAIRVAAERARSDDADTICVVGGGEIYKLAMPLADRLHITHVQCEPDGDTVFPAIDRAIWAPVHEEQVGEGEKDTFATRYVIYDKKAP